MTTATATTRVSFMPNRGHHALFREIVSGACDDERVSRVCDIGGGAQPLLASDEVAARLIAYSVLDVSPAETAALDRTAYDVISADACDVTLPVRHPELAGRFDVLFSQMVAEHVEVPHDFHATTFALCSPGGLAIHMFPTMYALPFVINRLMPDALANRALQFFAPRDEAKFPAFYRWCRGPSGRQMARLREIGWEVERYVGVIGHSYYRKVPVLRSIHAHLAALVLRRPSPHLTSFSIVVLRKPVMP